MAERANLEEILHDLVRLLPDDDRVAVTQGASQRRRALAVAQKLGVKPSATAVRGAALAFRKARGLRSADELSAWCADHGVTAETFARLMTEEATLDALGSGVGEGTAEEVADFLRVVDGAERMWTRARTLRAQVGAPPLSPRELLHGWYEMTLGRQVPDDVDVDARRRGFEGEDDLVRALGRASPSSDHLRSRTIAVGDHLPAFVLAHAGLGDVQPDLLAGRWWVLLLVDTFDRVVADLVARLRQLGGLIVSSRVDRDASLKRLDEDDAWTVLDDPAGLVRSRCHIERGGAWAVLIDPAGRVTEIGAPSPTFAASVERATADVEPMGATAPVLMVRGAFEAAFCERLINAWSEGELDSGVVSALGEAGAGARHDTTIKRRVDHVLSDGGLVGEINERLARRVFPGVRRAFQFEVTGCEGFRVGCYDASEKGFFSAHRDDGNPAVAHRRFALSVNLAQGVYEGGRLVLPEYGAVFDAPTGAALVYSASVLHEVTPVTAGRRFALVGFFSGAGR